MLSCLTLLLTPTNAPSIHSKMVHSPVVLPFVQDWICVDASRKEIAQAIEVRSKNITKNICFFLASLFHMWSFLFCYASCSIVHTHFHNDLSVMCSGVNGSAMRN